MKLYKWLYGAMALTMLGACSDNDLIPQENQQAEAGQGVPAVGYLGVQIELPQEGGTRAENDQFDDGTPNEYRVEDDNALILLFKGTTGGKEEDATFYKAKELTKPFFSNLHGSQISASYFAAIPVEVDPGEESTDVFYALVMLNRNKDFVKVPSTSNAMATEITIGDKTFDQEDNVGKFSDFLNLTTDKAFFAKDKTGEETHIFMTNAPLYNPTTKTVQYMTKLSNNVKPTADEAKQNVAGCVYVERGVAKVTSQPFDNKNLKLTFVNGDGEEIVDDNGKSAVKVTAQVEYALTNTNKSSYLIRNVEFKPNSATNGFFGWDYKATDKDGNEKEVRMVGTKPINKLNSPFHDQDQNLVRTYWCVDPNYYTEMNGVVNSALNPDKYILNPGATGFDYDDSAPFDNAFFALASKTFYCKENTLTVPNMNYKNSTMAVFKVTYNITDADNNKVTHLYIKDGNKQKIYLKRDEACADAIARVYNSELIKQALENSVKNGVPKPATINMKNSLDIEWQLDDDEVLISNIKIKDTATFDQNKFEAELGTADNTASQLYNLIGNINALSDVRRYSDCVSYYAIPIEHFGEFYTPWKERDIKGTTTGEVYPNPRSETTYKNYLGRHGVVRNNWYELAINTISGLGSTTIPDVNVELSDDNIEDTKFLAVEIHIMSWAKRLQGIDF